MKMLLYDVVVVAAVVIVVLELTHRHKQVRGLILGPGYGRMLLRQYHLLV